MKTELKKYVTFLIRFYGISFTIPIGQAVSSFIATEEGSIGRLYLSFLCLILGIITLMIGGIIIKDDD